MDINVEIKKEEWECEEAIVVIKPEKDFEDICRLEIKTETNLSIGENIYSNLPSISVNKEPNENGDILKEELRSSDGDEGTVSEIKTEELMLKSEDDIGTESNWKEAEKHHTITNIQEMLREKEILGKHFESRKEEQKAAPHVLAKHDGSSLKKYSCNSCDYKTNHKGNLNCHVLARHTIEKKFSCPHCDYKCDRKRSLKIHMLVKHDEKTSIKIYFCNHCDYKTPNKSTFNNHVLVKHDESSIRKYKCNYCEYKTNYKGHLNMHVSRKHDKSAIKIYNCNDCNYKSNDKSNFNNHVLTKHGESSTKKYNCKICDYKTHYKGNFNSHVLAKHDETGIKKYNCNSCHYKTNNKSNFKSHVSAKHEVSVLRKHDESTNENKIALFINNTSYII